MNVNSVLEIIKSMVRGGEAPSDAYKKIRAIVPAELVNEAARIFEEETGRIRTLTSPVALRANAGMQNWYMGPSDTDIYWPRLKQYLLETKGWSHTAVDSVDQSSTRIVSLLEPPGSAKIDTKGLVVGYVQSGKTANFTAVIAKAADAGYRFFIVLSGMTNLLRKQTQVRLEGELAALNTDSWFLLTDAGRDFGQLGAKWNVNAFLTSDNKAVLCVVKKNATVLRKLLRWLKGANAEVLNSCPVLVIDDEADQASINSAPLERERTAINRLVLETLGTLPKVAYIGYTATPFANVLIDPALKDLYPRSFIVDLPKPENYFGPERIFGRDLLAQDDPAGTMDGLDVIRIVPDDEIPILRPKSQAERAVFEPEITPSLERALRYFWMSSATRIARGQGSDHTTMLLHTSQHIAVHNKFKPPLEQFRDSFFKQLQRVTTAEDQLVNELRSQWEEEQNCLPPSEIGEEPTSFEVLWTYLPQAVESTSVIIENSYSDSRIDYQQPGRIQIVVGGNTLARGLTLEGLIVSFFLRSSTAYDTLLQMGRWFGYRPGYADLPRIWMTQELSDNFKDLATVEQEIRNDIAVYAMEEATPLNFSVRIRTHPTLEITSKLKMQSATFASVSYSGSRHQTVLFKHRDKNWLDRNIAAAHSLILGLQAQPLRGENIAFFSVPVSRIFAFFEAYEIHPDSRVFNAGLIKKYVEEHNKKGGLLDWNVVVRGRQDTGLGPLELGGISVPLINRAARLRRVPDGTAHIGTLMSVGDVVIDLNLPSEQTKGRSDEQLIKDERKNSPPLLIIYPISKDSLPTNQAKPRSSRTQMPIPLGAVQHVIGVGVVFPRIEGDMVLTYMTADLSHIEREELDFIPEDDEE